MGTGTEIWSAKIQFNLLHFLQRSSSEVRRTGFCHDVISEVNSWQQYLIFNITLFYINNNKTAILTGLNSHARKCKHRLPFFIMVPKHWKGRRQQRCNTKTWHITERTEEFIYFNCWKISRENHILLSLTKILKEDPYIMDTLILNNATLIQHTEHSQEQWNFIIWWDPGNQLNQSLKNCSCYFPKSEIKCLLLIDTHHFLFYCYLLDHFPGHSWLWNSSFFSFCLSFLWQMSSPGNFTFWHPFLLFLLWFRGPEKQMNQQYCWWE